MKKNLFLCFFTFALIVSFLYSCSSEEDEFEISDNLVGTSWERWTTQGTIWILKFTSENSVTFSHDGTKDVGVYKRNGNKIKFTTNNLQAIEQIGYVSSRNRDNCTLRSAIVTSETVMRCTFDTETVSAVATELIGTKGKMTCPFNKR